MRFTTMLCEENMLRVMMMFASVLRSQSMKEIFCVVQAHLTYALMRLMYITRVCVYVCLLVVHVNHAIYKL